MIRISNLSVSNVLGKKMVKSILQIYFFLNLICIWKLMKVIIGQMKQKLAMPGVVLI